MPAGKLTRGLKSGQYNLSARVALLPGDLLRVGCEDEAGHRIVKVTRNVPKGGRFTIGFEADARPESGTLVFLIDRREPGLLQKLRPLEEELAKIPERKPMPETFAATLPKPRKAGRQEPLYISVWRHPDMHKEKGAFGVWVSTKRAHNLPLGRAGSVWWWLPPVVWPDEESEFVSLLEAMVSRGGKRFVLGAPWQTGLFPAKARKGLEFWAGPFCNVANPLALAELGRIGFAGAIVSPELSGADLLALPALSPLPLGVVARGAWPLGLSRALSGEVKTCQTVLSPKEEGLWAVKYDRTYWLYPNWEVDLSKHGQELAKAGYTLFIDLREPMMQPDAIQGQLGQGQGTAKPHPEPRMFADGQEFLGGKPIRFVQDGKGNLLLARVVEQRPDAGLHDGCPGQSQGLKQIHGVHEHMHAVGIDVVIVGHELSHPGEPRRGGQKGYAVADVGGQHQAMALSATARQAVLDKIVHNSAAIMIKSCGLVGQGHVVAKQRLGQMPADVVPVAIPRPPVDVDGIHPVFQKHEPGRTHRGCQPGRLPDPRLFLGRTPRHAGTGHAIWLLRRARSDSGVLPSPVHAPETTDSQAGQESASRSER